MGSTKPIIIQKMGKVKKNYPEKFELDRERFIKYVPLKLLHKYIANNAIDDLIKGGEYIITAQDVLEQFTELPMTLIVEGSQSVRKVKTENIILTYKRR